MPLAATFDWPRAPADPRTGRGRQRTYTEGRRPPSTRSVVPLIGPARALARPPSASSSIGDGDPIRMTAGKVIVQAGGPMIAATRSRRLLTPSLSKIALR